MNRWYGIGVVVLTAFFATSSVAERAPKSMGKDVRVRKVLYHPADVIRIDLKLRINTAVEFGRSERITQVLLGDSAAFEVTVLSNRNTIAIKPLVPGAETNLTVYTNKRAISFYLRTGRTKWPTYRVVLSYPDDRPRRTRAATVSWRDTGYEYSGRARFRPLRVWNNGKATYFEFPRNIRPSIFGIDSRGYEVTLNSGTRGNVVRVPGIRSAYSVRIGNEVICVRRRPTEKVYNDRVVRALAQREF